MARASGKFWVLSGAVLLVLAAIWSVGLTIFAQQVTALEPPGNQRTDAIVALTGELNRLQEGVALLKQNQSDRLFISGVYRGLHKEELLSVMRQEASDYECCIDVGYVAANTHGNAVETAQWVEAQGISSLRLVTSNYHMPRSLLEFRRLMPHIDILAHPVQSGRAHFDPWYASLASVKLLSIEFSKYLIVLAGA